MSWKQSKLPFATDYTPVQDAFAARWTTAGAPPEQALFVERAADFSTNTLFVSPGVDTDGLPGEWVEADGPPTASTLLVGVSGVRDRLGIG